MARSEGWEIAQICLNGHVTNSTTIQYPQHSQQHCDKCGEPTITQCPACNTPIRGEYQYANVVALTHYQAPSYCFNCGKAFPWTDAKMQAAIELMTEEGGLKGEEIPQFQQSVQDIVRDTPRTQIGASRFKRFLAKAGKETASAVRDIMVDIVSETAKKVIWPDKP